MAFNGRWTLNPKTFDRGIRYSTPFMYRHLCFVTSQTNVSDAALSGNQFYFINPFPVKVWSIG